MSGDIVGRKLAALCAGIRGENELRVGVHMCAEAMDEAAAEIARLREALEPFARAAAMQMPIAGSWPDDKPNRDFLPHAWPDWRDFRRAARALGSDRAGGEAG